MWPPTISLSSGSPTILRLGLSGIGIGASTYYLADVLLLRACCTSAQPGAENDFHEAGLLDTGEIVASLVSLSANTTAA